MWKAVPTVGLPSPFPHLQRQPHSFAFVKQGSASNSSTAVIYEPNMIPMAVPTYATLSACYEDEQARGAIKACGLYEGDSTTVSGREMGLVDPVSTLIALDELALGWDLGSAW